MLERIAVMFARTAASEESTLWETPSSSKASTSRIFFAGAITPSIFDELMASERMSRRARGSVSVSVAARRSSSAILAVASETSAATSESSAMGQPASLSGIYARYSPLAPYQLSESQCPGTNFPMALLTL